MTKIEWSDATWNPIRARDKTTGAEGWACVHASPGCLNCYAETINRAGGIYGGTKHTYTWPALQKVDVYLDQRVLEKPLHWKKPRLIFPCSMTDIFGEWVEDEWLDQMFAVMALTPQHTYQVLTKRAGRMWDYMNQGGMPDILRNAAFDYLKIPMEVPPWPLPNVCLGVSAEDQQRWDERVPQLRSTPAAVRWVSYEPALGPVNAEHLLHGIDVVVVGGESGAKARPFDLQWARDMLVQCHIANVAVFVKQLGAKPYVDAGHVIEGTGIPVADRRLLKLKHRKGGDWSEWPEDLRVREWPV